MKKVSAVLLAVVSLTACGPAVECGPGTSLVGDACVPTESIVACGPGTILEDGRCIPDTEGGDFSCEDACQKLQEVCGFTVVGGSVTACASECAADPDRDRHVACYRGATCVEISEGKCAPTQTETPKPYTAYTGAGGPYCGTDSRGSSTFCKAGDNCQSSVSNTCVAPANDTYQAFNGAGGPYCGTDSRGSSTFCKAGDNCQSSVSNTCAAPANGTYQAFNGAGGPYCGTDSRGSSTFCKAGDTCSDATANRCRS